MKLPVITTSQARCVHRCKREAYYAYELGYRAAVEPETFRFGSLMHVGLEAWWLAPREGALEAAIEAIRGRAIDDFEAVRAGVLLQGYDARWAGEAMIVLAVEREFRAPIVNPETGAPSRTFELGGKLDVVVQHEGLTKLVEHKTSSEDVTAGSDYWKRLRLDPQVSNYFAGGKASGFDIAECVYDVIGKPALRPGTVPQTDSLGAKIVLDRDGNRVRTARGAWRQTADSAQGYELQTRPETADEFRKRLADHVAENPDRYFVRGNVVRLEQEELDAAHDLWATAREIRDAQLANRWPRNPDSCIRWNRECPFFPVCTGTASLDDQTRYRKVTNVHEELSDAA